MVVVVVVVIMVCSIMLSHSHKQKCFPNVRIPGWNLSNPEFAVQCFSIIGGNCETVQCTVK